MLYSDFDGGLTFEALPTGQLLVHGCPLALSGDTYLCNRGGWSGAAFMRQVSFFLTIR